MSFGLQVLGSEGDIRPLIALGAGLRRAGHEVTMAIHAIDAKDYGPLCERHDLRYIELPPSGVREFERRAKGLSSLNDGGAWGREFYEQFWRSNAQEDRVYETATALCEDNDVIIAHHLSYPTKAAALKTATPHISVQVTHEYTPTRYRPQFANMPNLGERLNPLMWEQIMELTDAHLPVFREFWSRKGLPPLDHVWSLYFSDILNLIAVSPTLCEQPPDWGDLHVVTGFLDLPNRAEPWRMSNQLRGFLDSGDAPIFMTFGSIPEIYPFSDAQGNIDLMIEAAVRAGCRALIQTTSEAAAKYPVDTRARMTDDIFFVGRVPYGAMFPACAAVVHHGGAGTSHLATMCCRPSIVVSFTRHHSLFGYELRRLGVAPDPLVRSETTPAILAAAIRRVLDTSTLSARAVEVGERMQQEDGVGRAVELIRARLCRLPQHDLGDEPAPPRSGHDACDTDEDRESGSAKLTSA